MTDPAAQSWLGITAQTFTILEAVAVIIGVVVTVSTINSWRKQNTGKRKLDRAESAMLAICELTETLKYIREHLPMPAGLDSVAAFEQNRSRYHNRFMALEVLDGLLGSLAGQQLLLRYYFGAKIGSPIEALIDVARTLQADIRELFTTVPADGTALKDKATLLNRIGWGDGARPDAMDKQIAKAVADMEAFCKPVLEGRR